MVRISNIMTTYVDEQGNEYQAIELTWRQVTKILGRDHNGSAEDDRRLVEALRGMGAPAWIEAADGWADEYGWGLIGPRLSVDVKNPWTGVSVTLTQDDVTAERLEALAVFMNDDIREELHREYMDDPWGFWISFVDRVGPEQAGKLWFS